MNATQLLAHFDRLAEAPGAVPRLRRFILDLAVRGKLVEQDAGDEPAGELLKQIRAEKAQLMKGGQLKRADETTASELEATFELPKLWVWAQLGDIAQYGIPDKVDSNTKLPATTWVLDLEDIEKDTSRLLTHVESSARPFSSTKTAFKRGDVLFGKLRPYLNKVVVADRDGVCTTEIIPIRGYCGLVPEYTQLVLRSPLTMARVDRLMYGMKMPRLGTADATALSYPLPPLAEQHRIVAKVDQLMTLCDQLEAAQQERERRRDRLVSASLQRLNQPAADTTPEAQREHARFHLYHLPRLTTRPEHIKAMRQIVLTLAVSGRLASHDPTDEPAVKLLRRINDEKLKLVKLGKVKRDKPPTQIADGEKYFVLPDSWSWVRMQAAFDVRDGTHDTPRYVASDGVPLITSRNFDDGKISFEGAKLISRDDHNAIKKRSGVDNGDILYSMIGGNIGNQVLVDSDREFSIKNVALFKCYSRDVSSPEYLNLFLKTVTMHLQEDASGGAQPFVSLSSLRSIPLPLPPLAEQHRIVAKVDELMALCDQLETQLTTTQTDSRRLLEAVLLEALDASAVVIG